MGFVDTMAHISLLAQAMGGIQVRRESPKTGQDQGGEGAQRESEFIPLPNVQELGTELLEVGELPIEGMPHEHM